MVTTGSISVLQARALKMKKLAKADKKAKQSARFKKPSPLPTASSTTIEQDNSPDNDQESANGEREGEDARDSELVSDLPLQPSQTESGPNVSSEPSTVAATFESLALIPPLLEALKQVGYTKPTEIQTGIIPHALEGKDVIGVAETGSGKTAAFALPILQKLWDEPRGLFACVLAPARELAYQIAQQFEALGSAIGVRCATIVGGMDMMSQSIALGKRPHIIVATPGPIMLAFDFQFPVTLGENERIKVRSRVS